LNDNNLVEMNGQEHGGLYYLNMTVALSSIEIYTLLLGYLSRYFELASLTLNQTVMRARLYSKYFSHFYCGSKEESILIYNTRPINLAHCR